MALTASKLRENIYRILDQVAETGVPVEIVRGRRRLKIVPAEEAAPSKVGRLKARPKVLVGDPQRIVHMDWSKEWKP
ncbi:MAG TPA: type II toxin-antitoxin system Phd/YefM family antitoxin [Candidatus Kryptonia bacterium]|nr:type II toxin-antitoxin system Phd/YefM family antitoxin [Candidatus Kryptonia bacterium]